jgi:hypothetical protein
VFREVDRDLTRSSRAVANVAHRPIAVVTQEVADATRLVIMVEVGRESELLDLVAT